MVHPNASKPRVLRVFLSSTFRDMQAERDVLARLVLPRLRREFGGQGAVIEEVDLRWGITEAMAQDAGALAICLEQLGICAPLVIGLVGHRVGWLPPVDVVKQLAPHVTSVLRAGAGITQIELAHASHIVRSLAAPAAPVFMRSRRLSEELASSESEWDGSEEVRRWCVDEPGLDTLPYNTLEEFEALAEARLRSTLLSELRQQPRSKQSRLALPEIIRSREMGRLSWATGWRRPTLIFAPRGAGTTWLIKRWMQEDPAGLYIDGRASGPGAMIDASPAQEGDTGSSGLPISSSAGEPGPDAMAERRTALLTTALRNRDGPRRIAFDHLDDSFPTEAQADISWIPSRLPWGRAIVVVTGNERLREQARTFGWSMHEIKPVARADALAFAQAYLAAFAKHLTPSQSATLGKAPWLSDLGCLVLSLDELRRFGRVETLDRRVTELAGHDGGAEIAEDVVAGLRSVMPVPWQGAVDDALLAMRMSLRGLEHQEIRAACGVLAGARCGVETGDLPSHLWSTIVISLGSGIASRDNLIDVSSGPLLKWCDESFIEDAEGAKRIAQGLDRALASASQSRRWQEAPRIVEVLAGEVGLAMLLSEPSNVLGILEAGESFASGVLDRLDPDARARIVAGWRDKLASGHGVTAERLAILAAQCGEHEGARHLLQMVGPEIAAQRSDAQRCFVAAVTDDRAALQVEAERIANSKSDEGKPGERAMTASLLLSACADGRVLLTEDKEKALVVYAVRAARQVRDALLDVQLDIGTGQLALGRARWRQASDRFYAAVRGARAAGHLRLLCRALERCAAVEIERHRFRNARRVAAECRELAASAGLGELEALAFERHIETERRTANWTQAYQLAEAYHARCLEGIAPLHRALECIATLEQAGA